MKLETIQYTTTNGWSVKNFPALDSKNTLILIFAAPEFINNTKPIKELTEHYPSSKIIGCSSAGEIYDAAIYDNSMSVAIVKLDKTEIKVVRTFIKTPKDSYQAGVDIFQQLDQKDLSGIFVLSNGVGVNGSELVSGLNENNKNNICITGGLAGDGDRFGKTWAVYGSEITTNTVVAVGFYGEYIRIGHASRGGWDVFGPERRVTNSIGNIVYEIDSKPALQLYKEYLGDRANELPAAGLLFPLSIRKNEADEKSLVRTILGVDESNQSLIFAGDIPVGYLAQLMRANFDRLISSAEEAGDVAMDTIANKQNAKSDSILSIPVSCVGRRLLLGERTEEETESLFDILPANVTKQVGFYSYGEISPYTTGICNLHNQTMTVTLLREAS